MNEISGAATTECKPKPPKPMNLDVARTFKFDLAVAPTFSQLCRGNGAA